MTTPYAYMTTGEAMKVLGLSRQRINCLIKEGRIGRFYIPSRSRQARGMVPRLLAEDVYAYAEYRRNGPPRPKPKKDPRPRGRPPAPAPPCPARARRPVPPVTEEDKIVGVLVLTGLVEMTDVFAVANRRIMAAFDASELGAADFVNAGLGA